jgi:hypothetical protein
MRSDTFSPLNRRERGCCSLSLYADERGAGRLPSFADFRDPDGNGWVLQERRFTGADALL